MSDEKLWFEQAVDGLFKVGMQGRQTPQMITRLRAVGIDLAKPLLPAYNADVWHKAVRIAAEELYANLPLEEGLYRVGWIMGESFSSTFLGKAMFAFLRALGPRRTLPKIGINLRKVTNYLDAKVEQRTPDNFVLTLQPVGEIPTFFKGMLDSSGRLVGAPRDSSTQFLLRNGAMTVFIDIGAEPTQAFPKEALTAYKDGAVVSELALSTSNAEGSTWKFNMS